MVEKPSDPEKLKKLIDARHGPEMDPYESIIGSPEDRDILEKHAEEIASTNMREKTPPKKIPFMFDFEEE